MTRFIFTHVLSAKTSYIANPVSQGKSWGQLQSYHHLRKNEEHYVPAQRLLQVLSSAIRASRDGTEPRKGVNVWGQKRTKEKVMPAGGDGGVLWVAEEGSESRGLGKWVGMKERVMNPGGIRMNEDILIITPFAFLDSQQWGFHCWFSGFSLEPRGRTSVCGELGKPLGLREETVAFLQDSMPHPLQPFQTCRSPRGCPPPFPLEISPNASLKYSYGSLYLKNSRKLPKTQK